MSDLTRSELGNSIVDRRWTMCLVGAPSSSSAHVAGLRCILAAVGNISMGGNLFGWFQPDVLQSYSE